ncbi:uncharacterized protein L201_003128 [Kwoniella dendrophila CBS 6074]|uniref:MYND-type domain-containing protein n=1 Tax=Kwoniella dendrophila CBS 6074 TaxID=1295534 RepID=A0AAX4JTT8_9TREE
MSPASGQASSSRYSSKTTHSAPSHITLPFQDSFVNLAKLIGFNPKKLDEDDEEDITDEGEGEGDDQELSNEDGEVDEESLMWDAQTALIAHHPDLAIKLYTQAALPPYSSSAACLALGNLLIRGSTLTEHDDQNRDHISHQYDNNRHSFSSKGKNKAYSGSAISDISESDEDDDDDAKDTNQMNLDSTITSRILNKFFGSGSGYGSISSSVKQSKSKSRPIPNRRPTIDLVSTGWQIPKEGKRAIRDPKSMGIAGAWFILGLSWLLQVQIEREKDSSIRRKKQLIKQQPSERIEIVTTNHNKHVIDDDEVLSFDPKGKGKRTTSQLNTSASNTDTIANPTDIQRSPTRPLPQSPSQTDLSDSVDTICPPKSNPSSSSGRTLESPMVQTPGAALIDDPFNRDIEDTAKDLEVLQSMYDLLQPLLKLYRHGHIQLHDPVALPPISLQSLPATLRPRNETEKGRNVWKLGNVVASKIAGLEILKQEDTALESDLREIERLRGGVNILINYILAMTSQDLEAEVYFRNVISNQPTGFELADDLIRQAAKRLDIITSTPRDEDSMNGYPFPPTSTDISMTHLSPPKASSASSPIKTKSRRKTSSAQHARHPSNSSIASLTVSRILSTPLKSSASLASLCSISDATFEPTTIQLNATDCAMSTLKKVQARSMADLQEAFQQEEEEELSEELLHQNGDVDGEPRYPSMNGWKLSPPAENSIPSSTFGVSQQSQRTIVPSSNSKRIGSPYTTRQLGLSISPSITLRPINSSPQFSNLHSTLSISQFEKDKSSHSESSTPPIGMENIRKSRLLPFEPSSLEKINPIDPELAKAELSSTLTKRVICGVCEMKGVNFPECRKCGLTFCSRDCRVGKDKAGNGKKHICGIWESRQLLSNPDLNSGINQIHVKSAVPPVPTTTVY